MIHFSTTFPPTDSRALCPAVHGRFHGTGNSSLTMFQVFHLCHLRQQAGR